jgi:MFS family permease
MYFIGVITFILIIPYLADKFGRKYIVFVSYIVFIAAIIGILFSNLLIQLYIFLFFAGATFGGRIVVGLNYLLEF